MDEYAAGVDLRILRIPASAKAMVKKVQMGGYAANQDGGSRMEKRKTTTEAAPFPEELAMYRLLFDNIYGGTLVTDPAGIITHINRPYCDFLGVSRKDALGRHCTEILTSSRMHVVARTGKAEINHIMRIKGQEILVHRIPVRRGEQLVAVLGIVLFHDVRQLATLARKFSLLESKVKLYEEELRTIRSTRYTFDSIVGENEAIKRLKKEALTATGNAFPVLVTGESGTGKELFAQAIHQASARGIHPFVHINCAAIPRELLEAELFGYDKGAFTGAKPNGKPGKFELAHRGTIFLDEIGELPLDMQPKLLRVLEEKTFERVGGTRMIRSDFRLIAATNQDLAGMTDKGSFRRDLFYRINVIHLHIPPLKERAGDIAAIAERLLGRIADNAGFPQVTLEPSAARLLQAHAWPGNVRELSNVLERTLASLSGGIITEQDLPYHLRHALKAAAPIGNSPLRATVQETEAEVIRATLEKNGYNKAKTARVLGIHRTLLYKKMDKYQIPCRRER